MTVTFPIHMHISEYDEQIIFLQKIHLRIQIKLARGITLHDTITTLNDIQKKDMLGKNEYDLIEQYLGRISYKYLENLFANVLVNYISIHS